MNNKYCELYINIWRKWLGSSRGSNEDRPSPAKGLRGLHTGSKQLCLATTTTTTAHFCLSCSKIFLFCLLFYALDSVCTVFYTFCTIYLHFPFVYVLSLLIPILTPWMCLSFRMCPLVMFDLQFRTIGKSPKLPINLSYWLCRTTNLLLLRSLWLLFSEMFRRQNFAFTCDAKKQVKVWIRGVPNSLIPCSHLFNWLN